MRSVITIKKTLWTELTNLTVIESLVIVIINLITSEYNEASLGLAT